MQLPEEFLSNMKELLADEWDSYLKSYEDKSLSSLRVNRAKISPEHFEEIAPYGIQKISFIDNGYYIDDTDAWSKHPYYFAGLYYLQEPSAMLPANRLPINCGDRVCDLCAAPGGKSTELLAKKPELLIANDISYSRTIPLVKNIEIFGRGNVYVLSEDPGRLIDDFSEYFDKILVDAPCSGEGMFRKHPELIKDWLKKGPEEYALVQRDILEAAYKMLRPGGMLMYSTCTFSPLEDEEIISHIIEKHADLSICDIQTDEGFAGGYEAYTKDNSELSKCIHIFPHRVKGEGHFLCLLRKSESPSSQSTSSNIAEMDIKTTVRLNKSVKSFDKLPDKVKEFINTLSLHKRDELEKSYYLFLDNGMISILPQGNESISVLKRRFVRSGLILGTLKNKDNFIPHTAFALSLNKEDFPNSYSLSSDSLDVIKYLKGETISPKEAEISKGYCLICVDDYPLGFGKFDGCRIKNLYEKGFRLM